MIFDKIVLSKPANIRQPKYAQLAEQLRRWIIQNDIPVGTKFPNNRQLAKTLKVTPVTLHRSIQELAKRGIVETKVGSGTYVSSPSHKSNKSMRIGVFCHDTPNLSDYYISFVLNNFYSFFQEYKSNVIIFKVSSDKYRETIDEYSLDGVMVLSPERNFISEIKNLRMENYPIVSIGTRFEELGNCSFGIKHMQISRQIVEFLAKKKHRNIGILLPHYEYSAMRERLEGYHKGMWENRLPVNPDWIIKAQNESMSVCKDQLLRLLSSPEKITALLIVSYLNITPIYSILNKAGYRIPEDISLIAFDDPTYASQLNPPLTVFAQPIEQFTTKAATSLLGQINQNTPDKFEEDHAVLIERQSVAVNNP